MDLSCVCVYEAKDAFRQNEKVFPSTNFREKLSFSLSLSLSLPMELSLHDISYLCNQPICLKILWKEGSEPNVCFHKENENCAYVSRVKPSQVEKLFHHFRSRRDFAGSAREKERERERERIRRQGCFINHITRCRLRPDKHSSPHVNGRLRCYSQFRCCQLNAKR